jgi:hypothetical protein
MGKAMRQIVRQARARVRHGGNRRQRQSRNKNRVNRTPHERISIPGRV